MNSKPLSPFKYFKNNKKKIIPLFISVLLSSFLIYSFSAFISSNFICEKEVQENPYMAYSIVQPKNEGEHILGSTINEVKDDKNTLEVLPLTSMRTTFHDMGGDNMSCRVFELDSKDINILFKNLKLKLTNGRMPDNKSEIILQDNLLKNKGKKIGDYIGHDLDINEDIQGRYKIVGSFSGDSVEAFVYDDSVKQDLKNGFMIIHKAGKLESSNKFLEKIEKENDIKVSDYANIVSQNKKEDSSSMAVINVIKFIIIIVVSIAAGNSSYVHYFMRTREFGILHALGYSKNYVVLKVLKESFVFDFAASIFGIAFSIIFNFIFEYLCFWPKGLSMKLFMGDSFLQVMLIPVFICIFTIVPVSRMFRKVDPITIIQGGV